RLPDVPQCTVSRQSECFEPAVRILANCQRPERHKRRGAEIVPGAPAIVGGCLPDVLQAPDRVQNKDFPAAIRILRDAQKMWTNAAAQVVPAAPAVVRRRLPDVPERPRAHEPHPNKGFETAVRVGANTWKPQILGWR